MSAATPALLTPRLGFLGTGWIGRNRLRALRASGAATIGLLCDPDAGALSAAAAEAPDAVLAGSLQDLLSAGPDGIVIATPSALHAEQAIAALESGVAVFCQKPLGRTAGEVERILKAARKADRLLGVDLSYRHTAAAAALKRAYDSGELGTVFAAELEFHNAYGPDKAWFRDPAQAGGGCVLDLGVHLVDLALWALDHPGVSRVSGSLFAGGERPVRSYARAAGIFHATARRRLPEFRFPRRPRRAGRARGRRGDQHRLALSGKWVERPDHAVAEARGPVGVVAVRELDAPVRVEPATPLHSAVAAKRRGVTAQGR